jgi:hypothetical protein
LSKQDIQSPQRSNGIEVQDQTFEIDHVLVNSQDPDDLSHQDHFADFEQKKVELNLPPSQHTILTVGQSINQRASGTG